MASFTTFIEPLQLHQQTQLHLSSFSHCKYSSSLNAFRFHVSFKVRLATNPQTRFSRNKRNSAAPTADFSSGISSFTDINTRAGEKLVLENDRGVGEPNGRRVVLKDRHAKTGLRSERGKERGSRVPSVRFKGKNFVADAEKTKTLKEGHGDMDKRSAKCGNSRRKVEQRERRVKKPKVDLPGATLRVGLDMCSKRGDVVGAIKLYELAKREGLKMGQYHYAVLLYLCSSAATGVVQPAKSGSGARSLSHAEPLKQSLVVGAESLSEFGRMAERDYDRSELWVRKSEGEYVIKHLDRDEVNMDSTLDGPPSSDLYGGEVDMRDFINGSTEFSHQTLDGLVESMKKRADSSNTKNDAGEGYGIQVSEDVKRVALQKGFEIYNELRAEQVAMNEATFTSVARMAMAFGDGDMAFDMVKQMKEYGINPRLRSYGPALAIFCSNGDVEKAFVVEEHMLEHGVYPEEPELEALLKVSMKAGKNDKVYYVLHKLRTSVRQVSPATADVIESWFNSKVASRVGKRKWDQESVIQAMGNGGGGWHGKGWLGKGKWTVSRSFVGSNGLCKSCGEKLVTIDLDPEETENFAKSVASMAAQREKHLSFEKFQKWLDYYGPFEAVVDAANVGLYSQRNFKPSKVNAVVNGIRQMLPSRKWPLIILHNRRITGQKMEEPFNKALIEKWKNADALYATPTGSNDDWYWLYAAIKCKCLLVTNDEMRDHLFQLLGNDFFPRWKERHQVRFSFDETGPVFRMPPPCSVVIQESAKGHWHIPIASEVENEDERIWLCCTRANSSLKVQDSDDEQTDSHITHQKKGEQRIGARQKYTAESKRSGVDNHDESVGKLEELSANVKAVVLSSVSRCHGSIIPQLKAAEKDGACLVDFQI